MLEQNSKFYTLQFKEENGYPIFLDGVIHESFVPKIYDKGMVYDWYDTDYGEPTDDLPPKLVWITKNKNLKFDIARGFMGFVVSSRFIEIFERWRVRDWEISELEVVNPKGEIIAKNYFYLRQKSEHLLKDVADMEKSKYRKGKWGPEYTSLIINKAIGLDFFLSSEGILSGHPILSARAIADLLNLNSKGFEVVPTEQIESVLDY